MPILGEFCTAYKIVFTRLDRMTGCQDALLLVSLLPLGYKFILLFFEVPKYYPRSHSGRRGLLL